MVPQEIVRQIEDSARIEEVVGDFLTLKRRGASFVACCPFHNEKTPSFYVTPSKGIYKCFGCGKAGSSVGFVMEYEHCSYTDALKYLAKKYNIEFREEELSPEEIMNRQRRESLMVVMEFAQQFYTSQLSTPEGRAVAMAYYRSRGLEEETVKRFGLGWAPSGRTSFTDAAIAAGHKLEYLVAAGLTLQREDGSVYDKFRERVMFPIHSVSGRVIAYSGRTLKNDPNIAKYVNSAETELYIKSRNLLGIYYAKAEIGRKNKCYLVEGNVDVITMQQLGISNVVASCGTALTVEQVRLINRFTSDLTVLYDGDKAGIKAALKGTDLILAEGMNVRIVLLPDGEDPDSFGRSHTLEEFQNYIDTHEQDFISFKSNLLLADANGDPLKRAAVINSIADSIAVIPDPVKRSVYVQECSNNFNIDPQALMSRIASGKTRQVQQDVRPSREPQAQPQETGLSFENPRLAPVEADILNFLLTHGHEPLCFESDSRYYDPEPLNVTEFISGALDADGSVMANSVYARTYSAYLDLYDQGLDDDAIVKRLLDSPDRTMAGVVSDLAVEKYQITVKSFSASMTTVGSWLVQYVPRTMILYAEKRLEEQLSRLKRELASETDPGRQLKYMQEIISLQKVIKTISNNK